MVLIVNHHVFASISTQNEHTEIPRTRLAEEESKNVIFEHR